MHRDEIFIYAISITVIDKVVDNVETEGFCKYAFPSFNMSWDNLQSC